jgi:regulatory protein
MDKNDFDKAIEKAMHFIGYRPRSVKEVEVRLKQKGFDDDVIDNVTAYLKDEEILDDTKFAQMWALDRVSGKKIGPYKLKRELLQKGISDDEVENVIASVYKDYDIFQLCARFLSEKFRERLGDTDDRKKIEVLVRNGFSYSDARGVVASLNNDNYK